MKYRLDTAIVPLDRNSIPRNFDNPATIGDVLKPADAVADIQFSRLIAVHSIITSDAGDEVGEKGCLCALLSRFALAPATAPVQPVCSA
jgi:hypothetical protein